MTEGPYKLPKGWRWVKLGEMCEHRTGVWGPEASSPARGFPIVRSTEIDGMFIRPETASVREVQKNRLNSYTLESGDILVNKSSGSSRLVGWPALFKDPKDGRMYLFSNFMLRLRPKRNILISHFLLYYLHSPIARSIYLGAQDTTSGLRNLRVRDFMNQPIPLPPLEEQRRIVARIEELMERIREARHLRQKAREDTERLWQASLADVFPRPGTALPPGWRWVKLGEVITHMANGTTAKQNKESRGIPVTRMETIANERIDSQRVGFIENPTQLMVNKYRLLPGDILFSHINSDPHLGKTAIYDGVPPILLHGMNLLRITVNKHILESEFLNYVFKAYRNLEIFVSIAQRAIGQSSINQRKMRDLPIPLPSLEEQRRIVAQLEEVEEKVKSLKEGQAQVEAELQRLEQSILNAAFRGEL